jgi:hypothetical protein
MAAELQKTIDEPIVNNFRLPDDNNEPPIGRSNPAGRPLVSSPGTQFSMNTVRNLCGAS